MYMQKEILQSLSGFDTIILVWGGTGGHISPIISLSKAIKNQNLYWIGGKNSEEKKAAENAEIMFFWIDVLRLSTTRSPRMALYPYALTKWFFQARNILSLLKISNPKIALFSKGWPGSIAIGMAAKSLGIPIFIHESDVIPGRSNYRLSRWAARIFLGFEGSKKFFPKSIDNQKFITTGQILDENLFSKNTEGSIKWKTNKKHILAFCWSQWAQKIFEYISEYCSDIDAEWIIVLWKLNTHMRQNFKNFSHIQILDWLDKSDQKTVFEWTDLAITRGSATTLAELELFQIPKIIIPLPTAASNHQFFNAREYQKSGDILLLQSKIHFLWDAIKENIIS